MHYCPNCGTEMDYDNAIWLVNERFYCSENCAREAKGMKPR